MSIAVDFAEVKRCLLIAHDVTQFPENLVLFDGVCNLCTASVQFIIRHDRAAIFYFAPLQSEIGREICQSQGLDPVDVQTFVLISRGRMLVRSDAAIEAISRFGGAWKFVTIFRLIPRVVRDWIYSTIARNRYRWFGRTDACMIPTPDVKVRFLG
jgi:predicted DCC family thiol-disulfide oxidoreductase YuxK